MTVNQVKDALSSIISELSKTPWLFLRCPAKDFTRRRKLCFQDVVFLLLSMEAKSTTNELLDYFKCDANMPTPSALRQQRDKILPEAFEFIFREFASSCDLPALYRGYRLLAADGSDLAIAPDPSDLDEPLLDRALQAYMEHSIQALGVGRAERLVPLVVGAFHDAPVVADVVVHILYVAPRHLCRRRSAGAGNSMGTRACGRRTGRNRERRRRTHICTSVSAVGFFDCSYEVFTGCTETCMVRSRSQPKCDRLFAL